LFRECESPFVPNPLSLSIAFWFELLTKQLQRTGAVDPHTNSLYHSFMFPKFISPLRCAFFLVFSVILACLVCPSHLSAQTADDVINAYLKARGGLAKIRAVQTERVTGTVTFAPGVEGPFFVERKRPLKMRMEITLNGQTLIRIYDGKSSGWIYNPFAPDAAVEPMKPPDLQGITEEADYEGPFVDYKAKGNRIEYVGREDVEGKPAQKLKLTSKQGEVGYFFFDVDTGFIVKWQGTRKNGDKDVPWETYFRDVREVDGLKYPFLVESGAIGSDQVQRIATNKVEINIPINDTRFAEPKVPATPAAAVPADSPKPNP